MEKRKQLDSQLNQPAPAASHAPPADYQTKVDGKLDTLRENVHTEGIKNQLPKNGEKVNDVINELTNLSRYTPDVISDKEKPVLARDVQLLKEAADELKKIPDTQIISSNSAEGNNEMQEQLKSLNENPLLKDRPKLPGGLYTVVVIADDGSENTLIEFTIPSP